MKILCVGYRQWALQIYRSVDFTGHDVHMWEGEDSFCLDRLSDLAPDLILFYGWSKIIDEKVVLNYRCLMLHPSKLPYYRGGSPIQNQIIRGELESAVTIFLMDEGIDTGDILGQQALSLEGTLTDIFARMIKIGTDLTQNIISTGLMGIPQEKDVGSNFARRTPAMSEITTDELDFHSGRYLFNKIRMLQAPYPLPYFVTNSGRKVYIKLVEEPN